jgi:hypothetical protein
MAQKIYGLIVGINKYPTINQLSGAVADAQAMHRFLTEKYRDLSPEIILLTDEQATRINIINAFRTHLAKAGAGDTVFFHFSGHGSREQSPEEFRIFFPEGKNETLVCYDSRYENGFDLADKELAVLLHELNKKSPHIVVSLDCCHSGSGTPNGGSPFGKVPNYLQLVKTILTIGLGSAFFAPYLAWAGGLIVALEQSKDLTVTLAQMKPDSDFIRELAISDDPHVSYYAIAGDITHYEQQSDKVIARIMEKMLLKFGNLMSGKEANDIAVKTDDILRINSHRQPAPVFEKVPCHHLNYFEHEAGVAALMKVL